MKSTTNFIKGYGKVNPIEDEEEEEAASASHQLPNKTPIQKRSITLLLLFLTLLIGATIAAFIIHNSSTTTKSPDPRPSLTESTRSVCSVTQYPESCFTSISSSLSSLKIPNSSDPELIFTLSLRVAAEELANISSLPKRLISESNETRSVSALTDCVSLFDDALSQLNNSVAYVGVGDKVLTEEKIRDLNTWISSAMTDQDTCLDGLEEMGSTMVDEVRAKVQKSKECMSNSLAILANIQSLLVKFGLPMH